MGRYRNIVVLTGSGISAESGLGTFRDEGGLWARHRIEDVATPEAFARDPELVQNFYNIRRRELKTALPNAAHDALARLERLLDGQVTIVTQNVDNLHEAAGSRNVIHMHGELCKVRCRHCGAVAEWTEDLSQETVCEQCRRAPAMRPHIVWFGEMPLEMERIESLLIEADLFISIGTSGAVYPAAGFVATARAYGKAHTVELNLEPSDGRQFFAEGRYGKASAVVPAYVAEILGQ